MNKLTERRLADYPPMLLDNPQLDLTEPGWVYEIKFDGCRITASFGGAVGMLTRDGTDATRWFPEVVASLEKIRGLQNIVDGEMCVLDSLGRSDFGKLHERIRHGGRFPGCPPVVFCVFDLLVNHGVDITQQRLLKRKAALTQLFQTQRAGLLVVRHSSDRPERMFKEAVIPLKLEGLVAKRAASAYLPGVRSTEWVKIMRETAGAPDRFSRASN